MTPPDGWRQHWQPGDPLSAEDRALLAPLIAKAHELGRTPTRREVETSEAIKRRFRTWGNAVRAAGLPWVNYPEQRRLAERGQPCSQAAPDHPHDSRSNRRGSDATDQIARHEERTTSHGGHTDHEPRAS